MGRKYQEKRALKLTLQAANKAIRVYCEKLGVVEVKSYIIHAVRSFILNMDKKRLKIKRHLVIVLYI